jgi:c(7)-type cytochrome triheme protein
MKLAAILRLRKALMLTLTFLVWFQWNGNAAKKDAGVVAYPNAPGAPGPVVFSHLSHGAKGAGYACDKCHPAGSDKTLVFVMDDIHQGRACGTCHDGRTKGPRSKRAATSIQDCQACHMPAIDIVIKLKRMDAVQFSHVRHLGVDSATKVSRPVGFSCGDCHPTPFGRVSVGPIGMELPHESGGCVQCHNGKKRKDGLPSAFAANTRCLTCHKPATQ